MTTRPRCIKHYCLGLCHLLQHEMKSAATLNNILHSLSFVSGLNVGAVARWDHRERYIYHERVWSTTFELNGSGVDAGAAASKLLKVVADGVLVCVVCLCSLGGQEQQP